MVYLESLAMREDPPASGQVAGWLGAQSKKQGSWNIPITDRPLLIGSDAAVALRLTAKGVAPFHAQIMAGPKGVQIIDLGARGGVKINGRKVPGAVLSDNDKIEIGGAKCRFTKARSAAFPERRAEAPVHNYLMDGSDLEEDEPEDADVSDEQQAPPPKEQKRQKQHKDMDPDLAEIGWEPPPDD